MPLPESLYDLIPLLDDWSIADVARRVQKLSEASPSDLSFLTERLLPRLGAIDEYLSSFDTSPLDPIARSLLLLAECALEARQELDSRDAADEDTERSG